MRTAQLLIPCLILLLGAGPATRHASTQPDGWTPLFTTDGEPKGFHVTAWDDVAKPAPNGAKWLVQDGVLHGSTPRGTWLVSDEQYADFEFQFDFRIAAPGNSGVGLRFPSAGDPAFDGVELQIMGSTYRGRAEIPSNERTGALYQLFAPKVEAFRQDDWNHYDIRCQGPRIKVYLNGHLVQDLNLDEHTETPKRGKSPSERPRKGHIGFQELSRGDTHVQIKNARIRRL